MKNKNIPENTFYNACILTDYYSFSKDSCNMLDEKKNINPMFHHRIEADACGNIVKVDNFKVIRKGAICSFTFAKI